MGAILGRTPSGEDMQGAGPGLAGGRLFYGWVISGVAALGTACGIATFLPSTIGLLVRPLGQSFGWSPQAIFASIAIVAGVTTFVAPVVGKLIDRVGAARVLVASFIAEALIVASFKFQDGHIATFYLRYVALSVCATGTTSVAYSPLISRWFDRYRGLALGISLAGIGLGGALWSLVAHALFEAVGWRDAFPWMGAMIAVTMAPLMLFTIRDFPAQMGLQVDGAADGRRAPSAKDGASLRQAMGAPVFWLLGVGFFLLSIVLYGVMLNLVPLLQSQGRSIAMAVRVQAAQWIVIIVGRIATGFLIDRFFAPHVAMALLLMPMVGIAMLALGVTGGQVFLAAMLVGMAVGAEGDMLAYMTGRYFGLRHYGLIYALYYGLYGFGTGFGPTLIAAAVQRFHGYPPVLFALCGVLAVIFLMLMAFPRFPANIEGKPPIRA
jgi:MFS family permease